MSSLCCVADCTCSAGIDDAFTEIEVIAVPLDSLGNEVPSCFSSAASPGVPCPPSVPYEATLKEKGQYHAITLMKAYENFSFEEIRLFSPSASNPVRNGGPEGGGAVEALHVQPGLGTGCYNVTWTPLYRGSYSLKATVDGDALKPLRVDVVETPYPTEADRVSPAPRLEASSEVKPQGKVLGCAMSPKKGKPKGRKGILDKEPLGKLVMAVENSKGVRVRLLPSLKSPDIGVLRPAKEVSFVEETRNADGVWVSLHPSSLQSVLSPENYVEGREGWCLLYNAHTGSILLREPAKVDDGGEQRGSDEGGRKSKKRARVDSATSPSENVPTRNDLLSSCPIIGRSRSLSNPNCSSSPLASFDSSGNQNRIPSESRSSPLMSELVLALGESRVNGNGPSPPPQVISPRLTRKARKKRHQATRRGVRSISPPTVRAGRGALLQSASLQETRSSSSSPDFIRTYVQIGSEDENGVLPPEDNAEPLEEVAVSPRSWLCTPLTTEARQQAVIPPTGFFQSLLGRRTFQPPPIRGCRECPADGGVPVEGSRVPDPSVHLLETRPLRAAGGEAPANGDAELRRTEGDGQDESRPVPSALRPSVAKAERAAFAAFLWHEGLVHDAMACASSLKFPGSSPTEAPSSQEDPRKWRHSLEVKGSVAPVTAERLKEDQRQSNRENLTKLWNTVRSIVGELLVSGSRTPANQLGLKKEAVPLPSHETLYANAEFLLSLRTRSEPRGSAVKEGSTAADASQSEGAFSLMDIEGAESLASFNCLKALGAVDEQQDLLDLLHEEEALLQELKESVVDGQSGDSDGVGSQKLGKMRRSYSENGPSVSGSRESIDVATDIVKIESPAASQLTERAKYRKANRNSAFIAGRFSAVKPMAMEGSVHFSSSKTLRRLSTMPPHRLRSLPSLQFLCEPHNLKELTNQLKLSIWNASAKELSLITYRWLLRCVTQRSSLHGVLWSLSSALKSLRETTKTPGELSCLSAVSAQAPHSLFQTLIDLLLLLPTGTALQRTALACLQIQFSKLDLEFLHKNHMFSTLVAILSDLDLEIVRARLESDTETESPVSDMLDVTSAAALTVSSNAMLTASLTDGSTETFWESGEEDKGRPGKQVQIILPRKPAAAKGRTFLFVYIDNVSDSKHSIQMISMKSAVSEEELPSALFLQVATLGNAFVGWRMAELTDPSHVVVALEFRSFAENSSVRVRQVRILTDDRPSEGVGPRAFLRSSEELVRDFCFKEGLCLLENFVRQVFCGILRTSVRADATDFVPSDGRPDRLPSHQEQVCDSLVESLVREAKRCMTPNADKQMRLCQELLKVVFMISVSEPIQLYLINRGSFPPMSTSLGASGIQQSHAGVLMPLLLLLHCGTDEVRRLAMNLLEELMAHVEPSDFAAKAGVLIPSIGEQWYSRLVEDERAVPDPGCGLLDPFLSLVSSALSLQVKAPSQATSPAILESPSTPVCSVDPGREPHEPLDWMAISAIGTRDGASSVALAKRVIQLLSQLMKGEYSEAWASVSKASVGQRLLGAIRIPSCSSSVDVASLKSSPDMALTLGALCVLLDDHVKSLSTASLRPQSQDQVLCENHEDGLTRATVTCDICGSLCKECDRVLHLNRRTRAHPREVFGVDEQMFELAVHQSCGRLKLSHLMLVVDSVKLKAVADIRLHVSPVQDNRSATQGSDLPMAATRPDEEATCRFCGENASLGIDGVCFSSECQAVQQTACLELLPCAHPCGGIRDEETHLPCLRGCKTSAQASDDLKQDADDMCMICFTDSLGSVPSIQLSCGHIFHFRCCQSVLAKRWPGPRISFGFRLCPVCKVRPIWPLSSQRELASGGEKALRQKRKDTESKLHKTDNGRDLFQVNIAHPSLSGLLAPIDALFKEVCTKGVTRLEYEGLAKSGHITDPSSRFHDDPQGFALDRYAYYECHRCKKVYFGGEARCDGGMEDAYDPAELVCGACSDVARTSVCPKHGTDFLEYKCRYCCSVAIFFCFGTTHFCAGCHSVFQKLTKIPQNLLPQCPVGSGCVKLTNVSACPLATEHPPTGIEFSLGCGICRNVGTF
ncbi:unnamed protein product [Cyprideis torosa]|uniref:RCR-type E3 ubiquitin transferase n=1 Tax=Cyprideis torosa TaxID=163714 RepID=A0A7R8WB01_9CRUS|nr:unnamed protein product [Cyprideis torosa]CAG0891685.1 unnamed protein product [Cyprideis torosa]